MFCYLCQLSLCCLRSLLLCCLCCWLSKINVKIEESDIVDIAISSFHSTTERHQYQYVRPPSQQSHHHRHHETKSDPFSSQYLLLLLVHNTTDVVVNESNWSSADFSLQILLHKYSFIIVLISDSNVLERERRDQTRPEVDGGREERKFDRGKWKILRFSDDSLVVCLMCKIIVNRQFNETFWRAFESSSRWPK